MKTFVKLKMASGEMLFAAPEKVVAISTHLVDKNSAGRTLLYFEGGGTFLVQEAIDQVLALVKGGGVDLDAMERALQARGAGKQLTAADIVQTTSDKQKAVDADCALGLQRCSECSKLECVDNTSKDIMAGAEMMPTEEAKS